LVAPDAQGFITPDAVARAIGDGALLVAVMAAQNEVGTVQPLAAIGAVAKARDAFFFVDASQALGKVPLDLAAVGADLAAFTAHKLYGPKGVGALWRRQRRGEPEVHIAPQIEGGGQERGLRAGTLNVPGIVGFGAAATLALNLLPTEAPRLRELRARMLAALRERLGGVIVTGATDGSDGPEPRLPGNLHVSFPGVEGAKLLQSLHDVAVSSGSACSSQKLEGSHVLRALGLPDARIFSAVRIGLGRYTTAAEVDHAAQRMADEVRRLKS
jgi:cysteine desulfurase